MVFDWNGLGDPHRCDGYASSPSRVTVVGRPAQKLRTAFDAWCTTLSQAFQTSSTTSLRQIIERLQQQLHYHQTRTNH